MRPPSRVSSTPSCPRLLVRVSLYVQRVDVVHDEWTESQPLGGKLNHALGTRRPPGAHAKECATNSRRWNRLSHNAARRPDPPCPDPQPQRGPRDHDGPLVGPRKGGRASRQIEAEQRTAEKTTGHVESNEGTTATDRSAGLSAVELGSQVQWTSRPGGFGRSTFYCVSPDSTAKPAFSIAVTKPARGILIRTLPSP